MNALMTVGLEGAPVVAGDPPVATAPPDAPSYLVVVARSQPGLFEHLRRRLHGDPKTIVLLDRRLTSRTAADRRHRQRADALATHGAVVIRLHPGYEGSCMNSNVVTRIRGGQRMMEETDALNERQRIDRWLEESQYLTGRLIPTFLDDRERLKAKLDSLEGETERLRAELNEMRRELSQAQGEVQFYKNEHATMADTFAGLVDQFSQMQKPLSDVYRRLQSPHAQPVG